jgi:hypothetical protein
MSITKLNGTCPLCRKVYHQMTLDGDKVMEWRSCPNLSCAINISLSTPPRPETTVYFEKAPIDHPLTPEDLDKIAQYMEKEYGIKKETEPEGK